MVATMTKPPPAKPPLGNRQVDTIRGQHHKFMLVPLMEQNTRWFNAGPVSIAVESRALGSEAFIIRGPSIHVFNASRTEEYLRFDVFGSVLHYHYILNDVNHNILWGYDPDLNGPMIPWVIAALRDRLPTLLRRAGANSLAVEVSESGWDASVLIDVSKAAAEALAPGDDDLAKAKEGSEWMWQWKQVHPQFNTVGEDEY